jgi:hypothetical protein
MGELMIFITTVQRVLTGLRAAEVEDDRFTFIKKLESECLRSLYVQHTLRVSTHRTCFLPTVEVTTEEKNKRMCLAVTHSLVKQGDTGRLREPAIAITCALQC